MSVVRITPISLFDLRDKMIALKNTATRMSVGGYDLFKQSETWTYFTRKDSRECYICEGNEGDFTGDIIASEFPVNEATDSFKVRHPRTHDSPGFPDAGYFGSGLKGGIYRRNGAPHGCGCLITWNNFPDPIVEQLAEDMRIEVS